MINDLVSLLETEMAIISSVIEGRNAEGFNEYGPLLEAFVRNTMEAVHQEEFRNLNRIKPNYKAIDLVNKKGTIVVQVSAHADSDKVHETIEKFEEINEETGRSIKQDYPQLEQLIIFGFCSASDPSKFKKKIRDYCKVVTRKYFLELLTDKLNEDAIISVRSTLRCLSYFNEVYTLGDNASLRIMKQYIDRNAIKHRIFQEGSYEQMAKSLNELTIFLNTGKNSAGKFVCKSRHEFGNGDYRAYLDSIHNQVSKILGVCNQAKTRAGDDTICFSPSEIRKIDKAKQNIVNESAELIVPKI